MIASFKLLRLCLAALLAASFSVSLAYAQKWEKPAAPFPEASEEVYGIAANGKPRRHSSRLFQYWLRAFLWLMLFRI